MSKAVPWSIKGVDFDARTAAKEAARRAGMTLGEWLNAVIAERAAEIGVNAMDFDAQERLEAVTARLARMSERDRAPRRRPERDRDHEDSYFEEMDNDDLPPRRREFSHRDQASSREASFRPTRVRRRDAYDADNVLEQAVSAFERRSDALASVDARLAGIEDRLHHSGDNVKPIRGMIAAVNDRLSDIESQLSKKSVAEEYRPLRSALGRLESRIEAMSKREAAAGPAEGEHISRLEQRLETLIENFERKNTATQAFAQRRAERAAMAQTRSGAPDALRGALAEIAARQADLDGVAAQAAPAFRPPFAGARTANDQPISRPTGPVAGPLADRRAFDARLDARLDAFAAKLEQFAEQAKTPPVDSKIDRLQQDMASLTARIETALSRPSGRVDGEVDPTASGSIAALENAIRDLSGKMDTARQAMSLQGREPTASGPEIESLRREIAEMARGVEKLTPSGAMAALESAMRDLTARIEATRDSGVRENILGPIEKLAADLRNSIGKIAETADFGNMAEHLREIERKIEAIHASGGADRSEFLRLCDQTDSIRDMLSAAIENTPVERLERQIAAISERLERLSREAASASQSQGGEGLRLIETRLDHLNSKFDQFASKPSDPTAASSSPAGIEPLLRALAEKLDTAMAPQADHRAFEALERQISKVSEKLENGATDSSNSALTRSIEDLARRLDQSREAVVGAAEDAARDAARAALQEAMANLPGARPSPELSQEIADLRQVQNDADRRTHETLTAVHETLEKVVDRLAMLEEDLVDTRVGGSEPAAFSPSPAARREDPPLQETPEPPRHRPEPPPIAMKADDLKFTDDFLLEPGAGHPAARPGDGEKAAPQTNYIDVARRALAAQAAATAAERESAERVKKASLIPGLGAKPTLEASEPNRIRKGREPKGAAANDAAPAKRKLPTIALAAAVLALGAFQAYKFLDREPGVAPNQDAPAADAARPAAPKGAAAKLEAAPAPGPVQGEAPSAKAPAGAAQDSGANVGAPAAPTNEAPAPGTPKAPGKGASLIDPMAVGAISPRANPGAAFELAQRAAQANIKELADKGDPAAQYEMGARYAEGREGPRDYKLAAQWFEKSAVQGVAQAQYRLGAIYEKGLGATRDLALAHLWYQKAAEQGNVRAMHNLAVVIAEGVDSKPDYASAAEWFRKAAEYGVRDSQYNLAVLYARGMGVSQNLQQSYLWFGLAAKQGDDDAARKRDDIAARLPAQELAAAKQKLAEFHTRGVEKSANDAPEVGAPVKAETRPRPHAARA